MTPLAHLLCWAVGLAGPETQTTLGERECLRRHGAGRRHVVEIGVWHGVTTRLLREAMAADGILVAVDPFPPGRLGLNLQRPIARSEVGRVANGSVRWIRKTGVEAARDYTRSGGPPVDLVFIDGDHSYEGCLGDWNAWCALVAINGAVALHDSRSTPARPIPDAGSVRVVDDAVLISPEFQLLEQIDSLTVVKRVSAVRA